MSDSAEQLLSAGVIVVSRANGDLRYLVLRAYSYWDFPKGIVDVGEQPLAGAIREVEEETTLDDLIFHWGEDYRETPPYRKKKIARYYIAETRRLDVDLPVTEELGHPEHDEYRWLSYEDTRDLLHERVQVILDWAHHTIIDAC
jgi:bis(5'-nucleosidyl)-tetraphosphatase